MTILSKFYHSRSESSGSVFRFARSLSRTAHATTSYKATMKGALFAGGAAVLWLFFGFSLTTASLISFIAYLATGGWRFAEVVFRTLPRDIRYFCHVSMLNCQSVNHDLLGYKLSCDFLQCSIQYKCT